MFGLRAFLALTLLSSMVGTAAGSGRHEDALHAESLNGILDRVILEKNVQDAVTAKNSLTSLFGKNGVSGHSLKGSVVDYRLWRSRFYNALASAAKAGRADPRVKALAQWGMNATVRLPDRTYSEGVLSWEQYNSLNIGL